MTHIDASQITILVVGDLVLEHSIETRVTRVDTSSLIPICEINDQDYNLGGIGSIAKACRSIGAAVDLLSITGSDAHSQLMEALLTEEDIQTNLLETKGYRTDIRTTVYGQDTKMLQLENQQAKEIEFDEIEFLSRYDEALQNCDVVILAQGKIASIKLWDDFIALANRYNRPVFANATAEKLRDYAGAFAVVADKKAMNSFFPSKQDRTISKRAQSQLVKYDIDNLLYVNSNNEIEVISQIEMNKSQNQSNHLLNNNNEEMFLAALAIAYCNDYSLLQSAKIASNFLRVINENKEQLHLSEQHLEMAVSNYTNQEMYRPTVLEKIKKIQKENKRIVLADGCFDVLHTGHCQMLKEAKKKGDILIVALKTDDVVSKLKGPMRPIMPLEDRIRAMQSLQYVDYVISYNKEDMTELLTELSGCLWVKGKEHQHEEHCLKKIAKENKCKLMLLNYFKQNEQSYFIENL